ncbi:MAG TPA: alcohol dehydrogenase catalytic domain-containing protein [Candidatus Polarisedimenticolaceae bacterium]|nr:alcohol dehydrogenase catalytic domain-containing protein [Candidatus Polarisedimenticolaceae bacterium]
MRAAVYYANDDVRLEERPRPLAGPGELVFRVMASGLCGSDVMEWYRKPKAPVVLGHEVAGEVVEIGEGLAGFVAGDRIVATHHVPCNTCRYCRAGHHPVCETLRTTHFDPGGLAELVRLPAVNVLRGTLALPPGVSYEEGSFVEPLACAVRGQRVAGGASEKRVAVIGSGLSGLLHIVWAKASGAASIVASDLSPYRLAAARRAGATETLDARAEALPPRCADVAILCAASMPALDAAIRMLDRGGTLLVFALFPPGTTASLPLHELGRDGISIVHSYAGPPADMKTALDAIANRRVDVRSLITHRLPLADAQEGFRLVAEAGDSLKVIVEPQR